MQLAVVLMLVFLLGGLFGAAGALLGYGMGFRRGPR